jgi:hypothetical protein
MERIASCLLLCLACTAGCTHDVGIAGDPDVLVEVVPEVVEPRPDPIPDPVDPWVEPDAVDVHPEACPDADGDGVCDADDRCPGHDDRLDADGDSVPDGCDRCHGGDDRRDADGDGTPDFCDCDHSGVVCDPHARCIEGTGAPTCECNDGFEGDGFTCRDIDECARGTDACDAHATCTNTPGGYACTCDEGYTGDGFTCTPVDHCAAGTDLCDANATCTYTGPGTYDCSCNPGYLGDGYVCTPIEDDLCIVSNDGPLYDESVAMPGSGGLMAMKFSISRYLRVTSCEVFTGERGGTSRIGIWSNDYTEDVPYLDMGTGTWSMSSLNQWQGATLSPVLLGAGLDYWVVWQYVGNCQAPQMTGGTPTEVRFSTDGGGSWGAASFIPVKFRCFCE